MALGPIVFVYPYVLLALIGLPVLWVILRALPPRPKTRVFAAVPLLLGLQDQEVDKNKPPLWLIVLRSLIVALIIFGQIFDGFFVAVDFEQPIILTTSFPPTFQHTLVNLKIKNLINTLLRSKQLKMC